MILVIIIKSLMCTSNSVFKELQNLKFYSVPKSYKLYLELDPCSNKFNNKCFLFVRNYGVMIYFNNFQHFLFLKLTVSELAIEQRRLCIGNMQ